MRNLISWIKSILSVNSPQEDNYLMRVDHPQADEIMYAIDMAKGIVFFGCDWEVYYTAASDKSFIFIEDNAKSLTLVINEITSLFSDIKGSWYLLDDDNEQKVMSERNDVFKLKLENIWEEIIKSQVEVDTIFIGNSFDPDVALSCLKNSENAATIIWDGYTVREQCHVIEKHLKPDYYMGSVAVFKIKPNQAEIGINLTQN